MDRTSTLSNKKSCSHLNAFLLQHSCKLVFLRCLELNFIPYALCVMMACRLSRNNFLCAGRSRHMIHSQPLSRKIDQRRVNFICAFISLVDLTFNAEFFTVALRAALNFTTLADFGDEFLFQRVSSQKIPISKLLIILRRECWRIRRLKKTPVPLAVRFDFHKQFLSCIFLIGHKRFHQKIGSCMTETISWVISATAVLNRSWQIGRSIAHLLDLYVYSGSFIDCLHDQNVEWIELDGLSSVDSLVFN